MNVNFRYFCFDCPANIQVSMPSKMGMYSTLKANFSRTSLPGFQCSVCNFIIRNQIGFASQVLLGFAFGKSTEVTGVFTDIGIIDVSCDDITDDITVGFLSQCIGMVKYVMHPMASCLEQFGNLTVIKWLTFACFFHTENDGGVRLQMAVVNPVLGTTGFRDLQRFSTSPQIVSAIAFRVGEFMDGAF